MSNLSQINLSGFNIQSSISLSLKKLQDALARLGTGETTDFLAQTLAQSYTGTLGVLSQSIANAAQGTAILNQEIGLLQNTLAQLTAMKSIATNAVAGTGPTVGDVTAFNSALTQINLNNQQVVSAYTSSGVTSTMQYYVGATTSSLFTDSLKSYGSASGIATGITVSYSGNTYTATFQLGGYSFSGTFSSTSTLLTMSDSVGDKVTLGFKIAPSPTNNNNATAACNSLSTFLSPVSFASNSQAVVASNIPLSFQVGTKTSLTTYIFNDTLTSLNLTTLNLDGSSNAQSSLTSISNAINTINNQLGILSGNAQQLASMTSINQISQNGYQALQGSLLSTDATQALNDITKNTNIFQNSLVVLQNTFSVQNTLASLVNSILK